MIATTKTESEKVLHCRFCQWTCSRYEVRRNKFLTWIVDGFEALKNHVRSTHSIEYAAMMKELKPKRSFFTLPKSPPRIQYD